MADHMEIERKYEVDGGIAIEDVVCPGLVVDEPETQRLVADYVDTEALTLAAHGITLRRRQGGADAGWHLKLPVAKGARREVHAPLGASVHQVPARLADLVAAHVRGRELVPVAKLETTRTVRRLRDGHGGVVAEVADDTVLGRRLDGQREETSSWREIEVELVGDPSDVLDSLDRALRRAGAEPSAAPSKLARVLGDEAAPRRARRAGKTAGDVLVAYLVKQREQLLAFDPLVRLADHDDDSVHKMRVAVRRVRSLLRTHARLLDGDRTAVLEAELKWLGEQLGTVRDLEVLNARFARRIADETGRGEQGWLRLLAEHEREARDDLNRVLLSPRYFALLAALDDYIARPPVNDRARRKAGRESARLLARSWRKVLKRYEGACDRPEGPERDTALHSTRKAAKRARYTAEAATPALGKPAARIAKYAEQLQETLGHRQDALIARQRLAEAADRPGLPADELFTLGLLTGVERCAAAAALDTAGPVWKKAARPKLLRALR